MDQEMEYLTAFQSATSYTAEENVLTMYYPGGTLLFEGKTAP
jgi:heat shock protein HslJ